MLQASCMAITSFQLAMAAIPIHNIAHTLGAKYGVPHGLANAVLMPSVMSHLPQLYLPKIKEFSQAIGVQSDSDDPQALLAESIKIIRNLREEIDLPADFADFNIDPAHIPQLIPAIQADPSALSFRIPEDVITIVCQEVVGTKVSVN